MTDRSSEVERHVEGVRGGGSNPSGPANSERVVALKDRYGYVELMVLREGNSNEIVRVVLDNVQLVQRDLSAPLNYRRVVFRRTDAVLRHRLFYDAADRTDLLGVDVPIFEEV